MITETKQALARMSDGEILSLYRIYSEECWAAGFMASFPDVLESFLKWVNNNPLAPEPVEDYEIEMVEQVRKML